MLQLETLLLLARTPERWWTAEEATRELRASLPATRAQLEQLTSAGLAESQAADEARFRYLEQQPERQLLIQDLVELHQERFHALVELIYTNRAREFADAFKLRKGESEDDG